MKLSTKMFTVADIGITVDSIHTKKTRYFWQQLYPTENDHVIFHVTIHVSNHVPGPVTVHVNFHVALSTKKARDLSRDKWEKRIKKNYFTPIRKSWIY